MNKLILCLQVSIPRVSTDDEEGTMIDHIMDNFSGKIGE